MDRGSEPEGYVHARVVYLVEWLDERDGNVGQLGGFTSLAEAEACLAQLESEGRTDLEINMVAIHERLQDWHYDR